MRVLTPALSFRKAHGTFHATRMHDCLNVLPWTRLAPSMVLDGVSKEMYICLEVF